MDGEFGKEVRVKRRALYGGSSGRDVHSDDWQSERVSSSARSRRSYGPPSYTAVLRSRRWLILGCTLFVLAIVVALTFLRPSIYEATTTVIRRQSALESTLLDTPIGTDADPLRSLATMTDMVRSERVAALVKSALRSPRSTTELLSMVSSQAASDSNVVTVRARSTSPAEAVRVANEFSTQTIKLRQQQDRRAIADAGSAISRELAGMTTAELGSPRGLELRDLGRQLTIVERIQTGGYEVWQPAELPRAPVSPRPLRDIPAGLIAGLVVGLCLAFVADRLDERLRDEEDFEREYGLPVIGSIPSARSRFRIGRAEVDESIGFREEDSALLEPYRLLRFNLRFLQSQQGFKTTLVTSGLPQEGKSTVAINLALSLALGGHKVALVDADLRSPRIHSYLGLPNRFGLSNVLAGARTLEEAFSRLKVAKFVPGEAARHRHGDLAALKDVMCLTAGRVPPNPAELLASPAMERLLDSLTALVDYVIVDSPPLIPVADGLVLAGLLDSVIVVGRRGKSSADDAREVMNLLDRAEARTLGVVINGVKAKRAYYYQEPAPEYAR